MVRPIQSETAAKPQRTVARISSTQAKGRSYTGCLECKLRKIKCDESKPTCGQCNRTGRECSGSTLQRSVRWSDKHEKFKNQRNPSHHQKTPRTTTANSGKCKDRCSGNSPGSASTPEENALSYPAIDVDANSKRTTPDLDLPRFLEINSEPVISPPSSNTDCSQTRNLLCDISSVTDSTRDVEMPYFLMEDWAVDDNQNFNPDIFGSHVEFEDSIYQDLAAAAFTPSSGHSFEYSASHGILLDSDPFDLATNDQNMGDCPLPLEEPNSTNGTVTRGNSFGDNVMFDSRQSFGSDFFDNFDNRYRTRGEGSIRPQPILESTRLVEHYFARVCALFSTFDSELNPFRLFVKQKWQSSELIYYTVQSMAAACLWDESPHMRRQAATNQILAVNCLQRELELSKLSTSIEALFALFLLGLSSCWHDHRAFGLQHLKVAQAAILEDSPGDDINTSETHAFFTKALIYWEMVTSPVAPDSLTEKHLRYRQTRGNSSTAPQKPPWLISKRIAPHPWAGISSTIQRIFGEVLKNVQLYMTFRRTPTLTRSDLSRMSHLLNEVEILEEEAWYLELPRVEEIDDFGDADTPACHHLLLAEGYVLACLYQIYAIFPEVLQARRSCFHQQGTRSSCNRNPHWSELLNMFSADGSHNHDIFGQHAILRLKQIPVTSGTRILQCMPLMVSASSLRMPTDKHSSGIQHAKQIREARSFITSWASDTKFLYPRTQTYCAGKVYKQIFQDLDDGKDVRWMELTTSLDVMTIFG